MSALLAIGGLRKRHGERVLFDIDSLALDAASAYVLTGVNGAGKSTLLRVLAGLEHASASALSFEGRSLKLAPYPGVMRAAIVYVHQHPIMFSTSVAHNIGYGLAARGVAKAQAAHQVGEAMEWAGVAHPDSGPAFNNLAVALMELGRLQEARVAAEKALALGGPWRKDALDTLGSIELAEKSRKH